MGSPPLSERGPSAPFSAQCLARDADEVACAHPRLVHNLGDHDPFPLRASADHDHAPSELGCERVREPFGLFHPSLHDRAGELRPVHFPRPGSRIPGPERGQFSLKGLHPPPDGLLFLK